VSETARDDVERELVQMGQRCQRLERELAEARMELADFRDATVVFRQLPGEQDPEVDLSKKEVQR